MRDRHEQLSLERWARLRKIQDEIEWIFDNNPGVRLSKLERALLAGRVKTVAVDPRYL